MRTLLWSSAFIRASKRLTRRNPQIITQLEQSLQLLAENPFHPSLRTHKLKGRADIWSCSVDYSNRILFKFV